MLLQMHIGTFYHFVRKFNKEMSKQTECMLWMMQLFSFSCFFFFIHNKSSECVHGVHFITNDKSCTLHVCMAHLSSSKERLITLPWQNHIINILHSTQWNFSVNSGLKFLRDAFWSSCRSIVCVFSRLSLCT